MAQGKVRRTWRAKKTGLDLGLRTFTTTKGRRKDTVLLIKDQKGTYHAFVEVEALQAAQRCGAPKTLNTTQAWAYLLTQENGHGGSDGA